MNIGNISSLQHSKLHITPLNIGSRIDFQANPRSHVDSQCEVPRSCFASKYEVCARRSTGEELWHVVACNHLLLFDWPLIGFLQYLAEATGKQVNAYDA